MEVAIPARLSPSVPAVATRRLSTLAIVLIVALGVVAVEAADRAGWVPHKQETSVYLNESWTVGEYRNCVALPERSGSVIFLTCAANQAAESSPRNLTVTFWGLTKRPDMYKAVLADPGVNDWKWLCRRKTRSLTCWAVN